MTEKEALDTVDSVDYFGMSSDHKVELSKAFISKIFDNFKSQTCKNCKHMTYWDETDIVECSTNEPHLNWMTMKKLNFYECSFSFGCIKWEKK